MIIPNKYKFVYDRTFLPLCFHQCDIASRECELKSTEMISREYFRACRNLNISHKHLLSNGMTAGEFAMYLIYRMNVNRKSCS